MAMNIKMSMVLRGIQNIKCPTVLVNWCADTLIVWGQGPYWLKARLDILLRLKCLKV